jgi:hypothetical protein
MQLIIESFENQVESQMITCEAYQEHNSLKMVDIEVKLEDFENWLDENEYLKGEGEDCTGANHEGEPVFTPSKWDFTIEKILDGTSDWNILELLTDFANETIKYKILTN